MRRIFTVLIILFAVATACLGVWQIQRGFAKMALHADWQDRVDLPVVEFDPAMLDDAASENRRVSANVQWRNAWVGYLDNVSSDARPGYYVLQRAQVGNSDAIIVRGFIATDGDRRFLPVVEPLLEPLRLTMVIRGYSNRVISIGDTNIEDFGDERSRVQYLERSALENHFATALGARVLYVLDGVEDGLERNWPVPSARDAHRSWSYAIQWFLMCFAAIVFLIISRRQ